jgi:hypothetical protein
MARQFLTGLNLNKNELLNAKIQNLSTTEINAISSPTAGQLAFDTTLGQLKVYSGTAWLALAAGGNVEDAINAAIDLITTTVIEEGTNLYYTESRAKTDAAELLTGATKTNITITGDGNGLTITAENGVADSDTDDLAEGTTNLYFTNQRAIDAGDGVFDAYGAAGTVAGNLTDHIADTSTHGVTGDIVGTTDIQDLSNKRIIDTLAFSDGVTLANEAQILVTPTTHHFEITANSGYGDLNLKSESGDVNITSNAGDIVLNPDGNVHVNASVVATASVEGTSLLAGGLENGNDGTLYVKKADDSTVLSVDAFDGTVDINGSLTVGLNGNNLRLKDDIDGNAIVEARNNNLILDSDNGTTGVYLGTVNADNRVVSQGLSQTLTNKTLGTGTALGADADADGFKIINLATPTDPTDAANKAYVDSTAQGLDVKASVHVATIVAGTLATSFEAGDAIDGHTLTAGDRILIKNQADSKENGIYVVNATGAPTRAVDADTDAELTKGSFVFVENGSQTSTGWVLSVVTGALDATGSVRTFTQFSGAGLITAGNGITKTGNTLDVVGTADRITANADSIDIASTYVGQSSITTLGTITTGTWNGSTIEVADGGTGATTAADARANLGAVTKYAANNDALTAVSGGVTWTVTHNLGTEDVIVQLKDISSKELVEVDVDITNSNTVTLTWVSGDVVDDAYRVVVVG